MPPSPTSSRPLSPSRAARHSGVPPGFIAPPRPKPRPIQDLSVRELRELQERNAKILSSGSASTSAYIQRVSSEQAAVEARLMELGMDSIQSGMNSTSITESMNVDDEANLPRAISAKQRALAQYAQNAAVKQGTGVMSFEEAAAIEKRTLAQDMLRKQKINERKMRQGLPIKGEVLTRAEMDARMWAFLNYKPTEEDMEDDDDDDEDDEDSDDPTNWFVDEDEDGRKGQDIVEPDDEDYGNIIRIDHSRIPSNSLYEREGD
ncbi:hypothetical protein OE88DRAFT_1652298 [Heliocybe sulcata]|uniref:Uncharacterized protein n=1 Tax=Heliocybe sulcata TaxID=5364 RepID=A0A5C3ND84_9AGAM|nr:hypothetical protein OE88DRAFT_1652298 [Heliocybe sulcata]